MGRSRIITPAPRDTSVARPYQAGVAQSRLIVTAAGLLLLLLAAVSWWSLSLPNRGTADPTFRVSGPSMSPTLWGPTYLALCSRCGWSHRVHAQPNPRRRSLNCFRCAESSLRLSEHIQPGDVVRLAPLPTLANDPAHVPHTTETHLPRGTLLAIRKPSGGFQVKRLVGFPGEQLRLDDYGQLWINDQPWLPAPNDEWNRSIEVYTLPAKPPNPKSTTASRWCKVDVAPDAQASTSTATKTLPANPHASGVPFDAAEWPLEITPRDAYVYQHRNIHDRDPRTNQPSNDRIRDDDPANAALSRVPLPVDTLMLSLTTRVTKPTLLHAWFWSQQGPRHVAIPLATGRITSQILARRDGCWVRQTAQHQTFQLANTPSPTDLRHAEALCHSTQPVVFTITPASPANDLTTNDHTALPLPTVQISNLMLRRGRRYDPPFPTRNAWRQGITVPVDHYIVFGDNATYSHDSRHTPQGVPRTDVVGRIQPIDASSQSR